MTRRAAHYTARTANLICERIALGRTLTQALADVGYLAPSMPTFWRWIDEHADFREKYERARQLQADMCADKMLELSNDVLQIGTALNAPARYRVAADILKWQAEVRNAAKFGKKAEEPGKNKPLDPAKIRSEIERLQRELGVAESNKQPLRAVK